MYKPEPSHAKFSIFLQLEIDRQIKINQSKDGETDRKVYRKYINIENRQMIIYINII